MFTINLSANLKDEGRSGSSDIIVEVEGKGEFIVAKQTSYIGRDRDHFTIKWDKVQLAKILPKKVVKGFEDDSCDSGCRKMDWWDPTEILKESLKEIGEIKIK